MTVVLAWVGCAAVAYLAARLDAWFRSERWTVGDRWFPIALGLFTGPLATLFAVMTLGLGLMHHVFWNRPARW